MTIGEPVIDFIEVPEAGQYTYRCNAGGGAANVASCVASMGGQPAMLGRVGNDMFGEYLLNEMANKNVDITGIKKDNLKQTGIGFVRNDINGERDFLFYRSDAETILYAEETDAQIIQNCYIYHYTSVSMVTDALARDTIKARDYARLCGKTISFDINYRPGLCGDKQKVQRLILQSAEAADITKLSLEELEEFYPGMTKEECAAHLINNGVSLVCITLGAEGCYYCTERGSAQISSPRIEAVDTTGCGDAFMGALLQLLTENDLHKRLNTANLEELNYIIHVAVCAASCCALKKGSFECMPTRDEVAEMICRERE